MINQTLKSMQTLAKVSSELRHNAAGPAPSILIIKKSRAEAPEIQVRQIKRSFPMNSGGSCGPVVRRPVLEKERGLKSRRSTLTL